MCVGHYIKIVFLYFINCDIDNDSLWDVHVEYTVLKRGCMGFTWGQNLFCGILII